MNPVISATEAPVQVFDRQAAVIASAKGTRVTVGITGTCPYGIAACWGGAYEALSRLDGVDHVNPIPNAEDSTAEVFLKSGVELPNLSLWLDQFRKVANGTYDLRGVEVTVTGAIERRGDSLFLIRNNETPLELRPFTEGAKIQWNHTLRRPQPIDESEAEAYDLLARDVQEHEHVTISGPFATTDQSYQVYIRMFHKE